MRGRTMSGAKRAIEERTMEERAAKKNRQRKTREDSPMVISMFEEEETMPRGDKKLGIEAAEKLNLKIDSWRRSWAERKRELDEFDRWLKL